MRALFLALLLNRVGKGAGFFRTLYDLPKMTPSVATAAVCLLLLNGTNPIRNGRAIVACGGAPAASSPIVPFSEAGNAEVDTIVNLPSPCLAPAVFFAGVLPNGAERWFAVDSI